MRKRTFELIAPLKFDCYRAEDLLEQLIATAQKKDATGLKKIIENVDTQRRYLFSESKDCLSKENFNLLTYSELQSYVLASLQHTWYGQLLYGIGISAPRQCPKTVRPASCFRVRYCPYPDVTKPVQLQPEIFSDVLKRLCHLPAVFQLSA